MPNTPAAYIVEDQHVSVLILYEHTLRAAALRILSATAQPPFQIGEPSKRPTQSNELTRRITTTELLRSGTDEGKAVQPSAVLFVFLVKTYIVSWRG